MKLFLMATMTIGWLGCGGLEPAPMESSSAAEESSLAPQVEDPSVVTPHLVLCNGGDICATRDACAEMGWLPDGGPCANSRPLAFCCAPP
jgi:hypothetical protein